MNYPDIYNTTDAELRAADTLSCTLGAHAPESVPADVRDALARAVAAALAVLDAVDAVGAAKVQP